MSCSDHALIQFEKAKNQSSFVNLMVQLPFKNLVNSWFCILDEKRVVQKSIASYDFIYRIILPYLKLSQKCPPCSKSLKWTHGLFQPEKGQVIFNPAVEGISESYLSENESNFIKSSKLSYPELFMNVEELWMWILLNDERKIQNSKINLSF